MRQHVFFSAVIMLVFCASFGALRYRITVALVSVAQMMIVFHLVLFFLFSSQFHPSGGTACPSAAGPAVLWRWCSWCVPAGFGVAAGGPGSAVEGGRLRSDDRLLSRPGPAVEFLPVCLPALDVSLPFLSLIPSPSYPSFGSYLFLPSSS